MIYTIIPLILFWVVFNQVPSGASKQEPNNACKTFRDYDKADRNTNCFYEPDMFLETPQLLKKYIGNVERHKVITEDGYILTMFHMPRKNSKGSVLLQHPLSVDGRVWVGQGNHSMGFFLWRAGYDVWLANERGTLFSQNHVNLTLSDRKYWDFSFHEIGLYDISSQVRYIKKSTGRKAIFIGHSLGTTTGLIYATLKPDEARDCVKVFILMGTSCYFNYTTSPMTMFASVNPMLQDLMKYFNLGAVIPFRPTLIIISRIFLRAFPIVIRVINVLNNIMGGWTDEADPVFLNFDVAIYIKNFSWKILQHYVQLMNTKTRFQMFDYGKKLNSVLYGSENAALYPIANISVPVFLISSENDTLTSAKDSDVLFEQLPQAAKIYGHLKVSGINHNDYHLGKNRKEIVIDPLLKFLDKLQ